MVEASTLRPIPRRIKHVRGFTYLSLIIVVAIIALVAASALKLGSVLQRSRAEQELLTIGAAFSDALKSYADATPAGQAPQPPSLNELLKDPRFPGTRRHLRKIFVDPMTGNAEWGITYLGNKTGVLAIHSLSDARPVKIASFPLRFSGFEGKSRISEWKFVMAAPAPNGEIAPQNQVQKPSSVASPQQNLGSPQQNVDAPNKSSDAPPADPEKQPATPLETVAPSYEQAGPIEPPEAPAEQKDL